MQVVLGVRPDVPRTRELKEFTARWKRRLRRENPGAVAAEKVGQTGLGFAKPVNGSTDLETMGVSERGAELLNTMRRTSFVGLSGGFRLVEGQLQSSAFEIVNVVGRWGRGIGFWTPANGLWRELDSPGTHVGLVVWPGESWAVPKGWVVPTTGKKLRVVVPVKHGFKEFVEVRWDNGTNTTTVDGYCIDVFEEVMQSLPYAVSYEFVPFARPDRTSAGTYNDMVHQVFLGVSSFNHLF
ncbi:Glutamate receptor 2.2 [Acorus calamus]|uniref:Glutamate receptor 2.2 n=1 Tax=Acorus calamus TaxID=4465 RepID=A0AAV9CMW8_ACOCL|nr:Glutamate receptor 2.2 [Acorus calamus]